MSEGANLPMDLDKEIGKIAQRKLELEQEKNRIPAEFDLVRAEAWLRDMEDAVAQLNTTMVILRHRRRTLNDAKVIIPQLTTEELQRTQAALDLLDAQIRRDQLVANFAGVLEGILTASSEVVLSAGKAINASTAPPAGVTTLTEIGAPAPTPATVAAAAAAAAVAAVTATGAKKPKKPPK